MSLDIDALCAAALVRLSEATEARIAAFRVQSQDEYHQAMRSIGQRARRMREALLNRKGQGD